MKLKFWRHKFAPVKVELSLNLAEKMIVYADMKNRTLESVCREALTDFLDKLHVEDKKEIAYRRYMNYKEISESEFNTCSLKENLGFYDDYSYKQYRKYERLAEEQKEILDRYGADKQ